MFSIYFFVSPVSGERDILKKKKLFKETENAERQYLFTVHSFLWGCVFPKSKRFI